MDVQVRDLRYFVAVAEELSFTRAASDQLFVSQPTLSKQIRQLELSLRTPLFERDRRPVTLTAAGRALLPHARRMIEQWQGAQQAVIDAVASQETSLTVGFQTSIGRGLIPAVIATMEKLLPGWRLQFRQVTWADPPVGLAGSDVEVAIAWLPVPTSGDFSHKVITREDRWVALPTSHRLANRPIVSFEDLADEPFIALPPTAGALREFWLGNDHRRTPARIATMVETAEETFEAVTSGVGIVLLSAGNAEIYRRENVTCRPVTGLSPSELAVIWRTGDQREAVRVFVDACCLCTGASL
ncbi:LysR family transcriptional regulator [Streptomyces sp. NPDC058470]|uniref:LysR family transcriptional regulator n=1 Tax=Streptomyces sp. NPDC058470 TaxID=3346515 RepID=UPI00364E7312